MENIEIINDNLEIRCIEFQEEMTWHEAVEKCDKLGDGWRLPSIEELKLIYFYTVFNNSSINDFDYHGWPIIWSSEEEAFGKRTVVKCMFFKDYYDGYWQENVFTLRIYGPKISTEPTYRAGYITGNEKTYNARFIAVRSNLNS